MIRLVVGGMVGKGWEDFFVGLCAGWELLCFV
jgi:hypothetical protein